MSSSPARPPFELLAAAVLVAGLSACTIMDAFSLPAGGADAGLDGALDASEAGASTADGGVPYLLGAYTADTTTTASHFGRPVDFVQTYQIADNQGTFDTSPSASADGTPVVYAMAPIWQGGSFAIAADGGYDTDYDAACSHVDPNKTFVIRIASDFNDGTRSWSPGPGDAAAFVAATQRLVNAIRRQLPTVKIDWNTHLGGADPTTDYYPGTQYVDIVSADFFVLAKDFGAEDAATRWGHLLNGDGPLLGDAGTRRWGLGQLAAFASAQQKPLALPDWGTDIDDGSLIAQVAAWLQQQNVAYIGYWDSNDANLDTALGPTTKNLAAFRNAWGGTHYAGAFFP